jgi:hypothetical protein
MVSDCDERASLRYAKPGSTMTQSTETADFKARAAARRKTWTLQRFESFEDMKRAQYHFWASQPTHVKVKAISDLTTEAFAIKGIHVRRLQRPHRAVE